ncbi:hypothetical protein FJZ17_01890 [Candidatus Pacearchaeota archaeon]|nr:hypothetical protein [Candidatus Pacearchaeota archaeon]
MRKPNLLVLGASGGVANAFLHHLPSHRAFFNKLVLLDKSKEVLQDPYIEHKLLDYIFVHKKIVLPEKEKEYQDILKKYQIDIVLDVTDYYSIPIIEATNKCGVSIINTGMNDDKRTVEEILLEFMKRRKQVASAPHILCSGMNPGVVNMWARYGISKFGVPLKFTEFEYDTSRISKQWKPMMTWSIHEFIQETSVDPAGYMLGRDKPKDVFPNSIENRKSLKEFLGPLFKLKKYPFGFLTPHEECISLAEKYDIPTRYYYAINMKTAQAVIDYYEKDKKLKREELILGDNTHHILNGSDNIGVILEYKDKKVYYFNSLPNAAVLGTNATFTQVITGIFSSLFTLIFDNLKPGVYFVEDLFDNHYKYYLFDNMRVQEFIFKKKKGKWKLANYCPEIKIKRRGRFEHMYI